MGEVVGGDGGEALGEEEGGSPGLEAEIVACEGGFVEGDGKG